MAKEGEYFMFLGNIESESTTTKLKSSGLPSRKKLLNSKPENWAEIVDMITSPQCRGVLGILRSGDYQRMCAPLYKEASAALLDALSDRSHALLIHEAVFLTDEQRLATTEGPVEDEEECPFEDCEDCEDHREPDDYFWGTRFNPVSETVRSRVNTMLRVRNLNVLPYKTNVERSIIASGFVEDTERHLLFRFYVPSGRLYAQEAEVVLNLFREWLGQTGRGSVKQESYSTAAGQIFEFFSGAEQHAGEPGHYFNDFSSFLEDCVNAPKVAAQQLLNNGVSQDAAPLIVSRYATRSRRLHLDLRQRREERMLSLRHELENVVLELDGLDGGELTATLDLMLPPPAAAGIIRNDPAGQIPTRTINHITQQVFNHMEGTVVQNVEGTVHLGTEAKKLLELVGFHGGSEQVQLETAVQELEDPEAKSSDKVRAGAQIKRFLADLGNKGVDVGLGVLQKYIETKVGLG